MKFSTQDVDNDISSSNCAKMWHGAWWFRKCFTSHLNGRYLEGRHLKWEGAIWRHFKGTFFSYKVTEMKVGSSKKLTKGYNNKLLNFLDIVYSLSSDRPMCYPKFDFEKSNLLFTFFEYQP